MNDHWFEPFRGNAKVAQSHQAPGFLSLDWLLPINFKTGLTQ